MGGFRDDFDGALDTAVWLPHYLPQWSSRAASAATYETGGSELHLTIPAAQGIWCEGDHEPPLRVSGVQSGVHSGPAGSTIGQQPFRDGQTVREAQGTQWGWTPHRGHARGPRAHGPLAALDGLRLDGRAGGRARPLRRDLRVRGLRRRASSPGARRRRHGRAPVPRSRPHRRLRGAAARARRREHHTYTAEWRPGRVDFFVDGTARAQRRPGAGLPDADDGRGVRLPRARARAAHADHVPALHVDLVTGPA